MVDINIETFDHIIKGMKLLKEFSTIDPSFYFNMYEYNLADYNSPEEWLRTLIKELFNSNLEKVSDDYISSGDEVLDILHHYDSDIADCYVQDFLSEYDYKPAEDGCFELSEEYAKNFDAFFLGLGMKSLVLYSPLITETSIDSIMLEGFIPNLIEDHFELERYTFVSCCIVQDFERPRYLIEVFYIEEYNGYFTELMDLKAFVETFIKLLKCFNRQNSIAS